MLNGVIQKDCEKYKKGNQMIMKKILICALALLCVASFAKAEDGWEKLDEEKEILLDWSEKPYMRLTDEYTGKPINVWTSTSTGETIYYVDYPWIVRIPTTLLDNPISIPEIENAPEPEGGEYMIYGGAYLASAPHCAVDQVERTLIEKGIEKPEVGILIPKKVMLSLSLIPNVQFIGITNMEDDNADGVSYSPLMNFCIAVPVKHKEVFEKMFEEGNLHLQRESVLAFKSNEKSKITLSPEDKENLVKTLSDGDYEEVLTRLKSLKQAQGKIYRSFTSTPCIWPDHGIVRSIRLYPAGGEKKIYEEGVTRFEIDVNGGFDLVDITYFDGAHEYIREELPPGRWKVFATIALKYEEIKDADGKVIIGQVYFKDLLGMVSWSNYNQQIESLRTTYFKHLDSHLRATTANK